MSRFQSKYYPGVLLTMSGCPYCEKLDSFVEGGSTKKNGTLKFKMGEVRVVDTPEYEQFKAENDDIDFSQITFPTFVMRNKNVLTGSTAIKNMFAKRRKRSKKYQNRFSKVKARGRKDDDTSSSGTSSGTSSDEDCVSADSCKGLACA